METLYPRCAGLDVHKDTVVACVRVGEPGRPPRQEVRTFRTVTGQLLALADWLAGHAVSHVAMESTGVYWKPVFHLLEGRFRVILVNARDVKQVPGRKTDVQDCAWLAQLLQHGLLRASFIPPAPVRELRDLTRQRTQLVHEHTAVANRIQKVLEDANIKLASVASDVLGVSGRDMLDALIAGVHDPQALAELARRRLRGKIPALRQALCGRVTEHHRFQLGLLRDHLVHLEALIARLSARIEECLAPLAAAAARLQAIPGVKQRTAEVVLAEIGPDMTPFPTPGHLASWARLCPGNDESAGKRRSGRTGKANRWLRPALTQAAWAAAHTRGTYFAALYRRLARRRGRKRALLAVAHALLGVIYHLLRRGTTYQDLGEDHFDRLDRGRLQARLIRRLEQLGLKVTVEPDQDAA